ncbi:hypothetical protein D3C81_1483590 [compost metagenome]
MDLTDALLHFIRQAQPINLFEQRCMQLATQSKTIGQGATIENRIAFAARCHQPGLRQHLQVVTHARLADRKNLRQFEYTERVAGQCP